MHIQECDYLEEHEAFSQATKPNGPWQVLHVRSNFEKRVAQHLTVRAIEHYLPLYRERARWTDRTIIADRPLFPGYVFARYGAQSRVVVVSTPGVVRSLGDEPGNLVSSAELDRIRQGLHSGLLLRPHPHVLVGTRVRVRNGVFAGIEGTVAEFRQQCKVVISVTAVCQCFSLEIESSDLEVLKSPAPRADQSPARTDSYWQLQPARP